MKPFDVDSVCPGDEIIEDRGEGKHRLGKIVSMDIKGDYCIAVLFCDGCDGSQIEYYTEEGRLFRSSDVMLYHPSTIVTKVVAVYRSKTGEVFPQLFANRQAMEKLAEEFDLTIIHWDEVEYEE